MILQHFTLLLEGQLRLSRECEEGPMKRPRIISPGIFHGVAVVRCMHMQVTVRAERVKNDLGRIVLVNPGIEQLGNI